MDKMLQDTINRFIEEQYYLFYGLKGVTEKVIANNEKNENKIEHLLDALMDAYINIEEAKISFDNLCDYYATINPHAAADYHRIFEESFGEPVKTR